jgi:hypothetical protein
MNRAKQKRFEAHRLFRGTAEILMACGHDDDWLVTWWLFGEDLFVFDCDRCGATWTWSPARGLA